MVSAIVEEAVNNEVAWTLESGDKLTTVITRASCQSMDLAGGKPAIALVKAPWVILASAECGLNFSARNQFHGKVRSVTKGAVNSSLQLVTAGGLTLTSTVTNESLVVMNIDVGSELIALVKASSIILATRN